METSTKYVIIFDHDNPKKELSFADLEKVMQFLEESDVLTETFGRMAEKLDDTPRAAVREAPELPDFCSLADTLMELTDKAEEYRDKLNSFIQEADEVLETLSDLDAYWDDAE